MPLKSNKIWEGMMCLWNIPDVGLGFFLSFKISGRGITAPDAYIPLETRTLVPSSKYLYPVLHGFLQSNCVNKYSLKKTWKKIKYHTYRVEYFFCLPKYICLETKGIKRWSSIIPGDRINYLYIWNMKWSFNWENPTSMSFPLLNMFLNLKCVNTQLFK
jgi:hypothetical protein